MMPMTLEQIAILQGLSPTTGKKRMSNLVKRALRKLRWPPDKRTGRDPLGQQPKLHAYRRRRHKLRTYR